MDFMSLYRTQEGKKQFLCPLIPNHKLDTVSDWLHHMCDCQLGSDLIKHFICRFNHFHWFTTQKERVLHETFHCPDRLTAMSHTEVIVNSNNDVWLPLQKECFIALSQYFKRGNFQPRPNYRNFLFEFKQDTIERLHVQRKRRKPNSTERPHRQQRTIQIDLT